MNERTELVVWIDLDSLEKVKKIDFFIPACDYANIEKIHPYEWGRVDQKNLIIRFRASTAITEIKKIFNER